NLELNGKGILSGRGQAFIDASKKYNINEIYLISHAYLETNRGKSPLSTGIEVGVNNKGGLEVVNSTNRSNLKNIKKTYNMFGIGAYDSCPETCGATRAYEEKWFTPEEAIIGGSKFVADNYVYSTYKQDTLYKMRWNPGWAENNSNATHQYASDIGWAKKQADIMKGIYDKLSTYTVSFDIPKYK